MSLFKVIVVFLEFTSYKQLIIHDVKALSFLLLRGKKGLSVFFKLKMPSC